MVWDSSQRSGKHGAGARTTQLMNARARYEIRVAGQLGEAAATAFAGLELASRGEVTVITGEFDQAGLHGILERIRSLGLDLLEAQRLGGPPRRAAD